MTTELVTALGLILVIEGLLYAVLPDVMKRMILEIAERPAATLRAAGLAAAALGVGLVWLARG